MVSNGPGLQTECEDAMSSSTGGFTIEVVVGMASAVFTKECSIALLIFDVVLLVILRHIFIYKSEGWSSLCVFFR